MTILKNLSLLWGTVAWVGMMIVFGFAMAALIVLPSKWDHAVALKVCGGLPIVQLTDGSIWLRDRWRKYQVKNLDAMECN